MANFLQALNWKPRPAGHYPLDLDASLRYTRFGTGTTPWPYPPIIGMVQGFMAQQDFAVWRGMFGRLPYGPGSTTLPLNLQDQVTVPGLNKVAS